MHSLLSICMNENTSFTKMVLLNSLNAQTDHDIRLNKKVDDVKLNTKQHHLNGYTLQDVVLLKIEKFAESAQIWSQRFPLVITKTLTSCTYIGVAHQTNKSYF